MNEININYTYVFWGNKEAYESRQYRRIGNEGSTSSSKTHSLCQLMITIALQEQKSISIVSPSLPHLKRGAMRNFFNILQEWNLYKEKNHNKTDKIYHFPKSYVEFFGVEDAGKVRGPRRNILYVNEANLIDYEVYKQLALRTDETIFWDLNPADEFSWCYTEIDNVEGSRKIRSTYKNNLDNLTDENIREIESLKDADENLWRVFGLGLRGTSSETIYTHWKTCENMPACDEFFYGLDFGYNNPSALVKVGILDGKLYAEEILYETKLTTNDLTEVIKMHGINRHIEIFCDAAEPKTIEELRRMGLYARPAEKSVYDGIQMIKSYPLYITANSTNLIKEIKSYKWKTKDGKVVIPEQPVKFMDHGMDALRYAVFTKLSKPSFKILI